MNAPEEPVFVTMNLQPKRTKEAKSGFDERTDSFNRTAPRLIRQRQIETTTGTWERKTLTSTGSNPTRVACPQCLSMVTVPETMGGQRIVCPQCKRSLLVPSVLAGAGTIFDNLFDAEPDKSPASTVAKPVTPHVPHTAATSRVSGEDDELMLAAPDQVTPTSRTPVSTPTGFTDGVDPFDNVQPADVDFIEGSGTNIFDLGNVDMEAKALTVELPDANASIPEMAEIPATKSSSEIIQDDDFKIELDLPDLLAQNSTPSRLSSQKEFDPFIEDPDRPLRIDGISPDRELRDTLGVRCGVCDTLIYVAKSQVGETVKCPECFSPIVANVAAPRTSATNPWAQKLREASQEADEYKLSEPVERPAEAKHIPEGYGLASNETDLLAPIYAPNVEADEVGVQSGTDRSGRNEGGVRPSSASRPHKNPPFKKMPNDQSGAAEHRSESQKTAPQSTSTAYWKNKPHAATDPVETENEKLEADPIGLTFSDLGGFTGGMSRWMTAMSTDFELIVRILTAAGLMGVGYWIFDGIWGWTTSEEPVQSYVFYAIMLGLIGVPTFFAGCLMLLITGALMFQRGGERKPRYKVWPGYGWGDWGTPVIFVVFSLWLSSLPGAMLGLLFTIGSENVVFIPIFVGLSVFMLMPPMLVSAYHNQSAIQIVSKKVFRHFTPQDTDWLRYLPASGLALVLFLAGTLLLLVPMFLFSFIGAAIQVIAIVLFGSFTGLYCGMMADKVDSADEQSGK